MSRLTSSSPRRSLHPTGAGRDRGVPGGALRGGTAGSDWMTYLKPEGIYLREYTLIITINIIVILCQSTRDKTEPEF